MTEQNTLVDELVAEIKRVTAKKERWQQMMREHNVRFGMQFSIHVMQAQIERGVESIATGEAGQMMRALESLKGYNDDD